MGSKNIIPTGRCVFMILFLLRGHLETEYIMNFRNKSVLTSPGTGMVLTPPGADRVGIF